MIQARILYDIIGLSGTERLILVVLSHIKTIKEVVVETGVSRTGVIYCLGHLVKRGFVHVIHVGKRKSYVALSPAELASHIQSKLDESATVQRKGARIKMNKEDEFIIHVGAKEIIPAYARIASENKNERIKAIQHHKSYNELLDKITSKQLIAFNNSIKKNKLIIDGILNESAYRDYSNEVKSNPKKYLAEVKSLEGRMADYTFFADSVFKHFAELWLFKDTSLLINWHDEVAIEITNRSMTAFLKDMFEFVKKDGIKVDHNKAMRNLLDQQKSRPVGGQL